MENKIKTQIQRLKQFNIEHKIWLALSLFVLIGTTVTIFDWNFIYQHRLECLAIASGLLISIVWWYWTMRITKELIAIKIADREILQEIIEDVQHVRAEILKTLPKRD
jgi:hypothetical protein